MSVQWNALMNQPNPGMQAVQGFQQGMQLKQQRDMQAMQMQGLQEDRQLRQQTAQAQIDEAQRGKILQGARIFRGLKSKHPELDDTQIYQMAMPIFSQMKIDVSTLPQPGDPNLPQFLQGALAIADEFEPPKGDPGLMREFEGYSQLPPDRQRQMQQFMQMRYPGMQSPVVIPHDAVQVGGGQPPARVNSPQEVEALPPGATFIAPDGSVRVKPGGSGGNVGGNF
jgi:hypothetical protein